MLNGTIPREIGNLSLAKEIDFSENFLSGDIPFELSKIAGLRLLYLFENQLTGVIPDELTTLTNLTRLDLSMNFLTGSIPTGFQYMTELMMLQLFHNLLSGIIPQGLGVYSPLWVVDLSENLLTGRIPRHLCRNSIMILLNLGSNRLTGNIPTDITGCKSLVQLRLVGNNLTGTFPSVMCKLANLSTVELGQNKFSGAIPPEIGNCRTLQRLHLSGNYFAFELPREIGNLSQLVTFNVSSNLLSGRIPPEIFNCRMLQRLDLSNNNFLDALPSEIGTLFQLELLKLSENNLSGNIPGAVGNLLRLTELQMGGNSFSGGIPAELGALSSLQIALNLSYNNLSGEIPPQLGNLILLEFLLLNNNNLTGDIPGSFESLKSLLGCNFSFNGLTGPIPRLPLFQNMPANSFFGNKGLCGGPLGDCGTPPSSLSFPQDMVKKSSRLGKIVAIISAAIGGVSLILIVVLIYVMRRPVDVASVQEKPCSSPVLDTYFSPKAGFTFEDLVMVTENFDESFEIGRGACGTVYKAVLPTGHTVAVKKGSNLLLYEYMERGSLGELLHGTSCSLDWITRFMIALGAAQGLAYLHHDCKPMIIHRDIKSNNILLDDKFEAHVGDFGLAKVIDMPQSKSMSAVAGSYGYIAPEYAYTLKVTEKCDIYSYGVVLLELLTGRTPVQSIDQGGDLVTWVRNYFLHHSLSSGVFDARLNLEDEATVAHMITVLKIALLCTSMSPWTAQP
ncbi:putative leucine-rich repeat receptor-like protein kinase [Prunus yedoensis var. nudiflora]|uniref:non-specific serine/threonine protein kinase n=1 Tax=Prunus yedoensis var. nudiflora TaxID=2094558 RepID=A0A314ZRA7_PRUYE|nr:putative leucine-rich repeat receptor-like protein kinase [Prunus yedoensis var. nudiflora]